MGCFCVQLCYGANITTLRASLGRASVHGKDKETKKRDSKSRDVSSGCAVNQGCIFQMFFPFAKRLCRHSNVNQGDPLRLNTRTNSAISRFHIGADEGKSTSAATSHTENGECQAGAPNQDRSCSEMCLGVSLLFLLRRPASREEGMGVEGGIGLYDGSRA